MHECGCIVRSRGALREAPVLARLADLGEFDVELGIVGLEIDAIRLYDGRPIERPTDLRAGVSYGLAVQHERITGCDCGALWLYGYFRGIWKSSRRRNWGWMNNLKWRRID